MTEYRIIHHHNLAEFQRLVSAAMADGWDPRGGVAVSNGEYVQALVRTLPVPAQGEVRLKEPKRK